MSFSEAFNFPFKNNNLNKIIQIGIAFGIIYAIETVLNGGQPAGFGSIFGLIGGVLFGLFVSGYGIFVIQNILSGDQSLPEFQISESIGRGFKVFLASLVYFLPVIIFVIAILLMLGPVIGNIFNEITLGLENPNYVPDTSPDGSAMFPLFFCGAMLLIVPATFILGYAAQMGMLRFAIEDRSGALFEFGTNIKMVFDNSGKVFKLFLIQFAIGIVFGIIGLVLGGVIGGIIGFSGGGTSALAIVFLVVLNLASAVINTVQQMANLHLIAGFGMESGIAGGKAKRGKNDGTLDEAYDF